MHSLKSSSAAAKSLISGVKTLVACKRKRRNIPKSADSESDDWNLRSFIHRIVTPVPRPVWHRNP